MAGLQTFFKEIKKASRGHRIVSVGIEFGSSSLKLVQLIEDKGVVRLGNYGEIDLGPFVGKPRGSIANLDLDKLQEATMTLINNVPIDDPEAIAVAIPLSATLVIPLEIDQVRPENIELAIRQKIEKEIPVPIDQVYIDWQIIENVMDDSGQKIDNEDVDEKASKNKSETAKAVTDKAGEPEVIDVSADKMKLLCFIINKDIIDTYRTVLDNLGLSIEYFELEAYSVLRSAIPNNVTEAMVVDIGARYTKIYAIRNGKIVHAIKKLHGGKDYTQIIAENLDISIEKAEELKRTMNLSQMTDGVVANTLRQSISRLVDSLRLTQREHNIKADSPIYLCGGGSLLFGLPEYIAQTMSVKIIICQPFMNTQAPKYLDKLLVETGPEYAVATGLALKHIRTI